MLISKTMNDIMGFREKMLIILLAGFDTRLNQGRVLRKVPTNHSP